MLCPRADTEVVAQAAAETLDGHRSAPGAGPLRRNRLSGAGGQALLPRRAGDLRGKSPAAFAYLEKNARCALTGQGRQTENVLEPSALEQANVPAFDWGPSLNALRANQKSAYAVQPVQGDLFTYWETLPEGQLELIVSNPPYLTAAGDGAAAARGGTGACHGVGSRGGRPCVSSRALASTTKTRCAPAGRWYWRSAGSNGKP
ncbi:MAG: hypothetical protein ACLVJH_16665 [Faecalibacterium prausnitzii]